MRGNKFRFWDKKQRIWLDSAMLAVTGCGEVFSTETLEFLLDVDVVNYTGLTDKNGVEIYEGDIVHIRKDRFGVGGDEVWTVEYYTYYASFRCYNQINSDREIEDDYEGVRCEVTPEYFFILEVVGNIYENPELLEAEK